MASLRDIERKGALSVLVFLATHGEATGMEFYEASGIVNTLRVVELRNALEEAGLIKVEELPARGAAKPIRITTTAFGRGAAELANALKRYLEGDLTVDRARAVENAVRKALGGSVAGSGGGEKRTRKR